MQLQFYLIQLKIHKQALNICVPKVFLVPVMTDGTVVSIVWDLIRQYNSIVNFQACVLRIRVYGPLVISGRFLENP